MLSKQLINIEERRRAATFDSDPRLTELLVRASSACVEVLRIYEQYADLAAGKDAASAR